MPENVLAGSSNFVDPRVLCPTTGEICPARRQSVELFDIHVDAGRALEVPPEWHPGLDSMKLVVRLTEHAGQAYRTNCDGPIEDTCPTRETMDRSVIRAKVVNGLRVLYGKVVYGW